MGIGEKAYRSLLKILESKANTPSPPMIRTSKRSCGQACSEKLKSAMMVNRKLAPESPFHGFFTLFWISMALLLTRIAAGNYRTQGSVFGEAEILHLMVDRDLFVMLTTDVSMCVATSFGFFLHKAIAKDYLTWNGSGWIIQSLWQTFFTVTVIWVTFWRDWPWTHTVFIVLHVFVLLMKQHAYSFYNGYCKLFPYHK
jgi:hypothetical protein